jgi:hypothetical protein
MQTFNPEAEMTTFKRTSLTLFLATLIITPLAAQQARELAAKAAEAAPKTKTAKASDSSKPTIELYGYVKLDASYDDSTVAAGNFARWVTSPSAIEPHDHFNMTARQTRLGMRIGRARDGNLIVKGRVEIDFYGGGSENKNQPMLRHGYAEIDWPEKGLNLKAGQTSDLISPLVPTTINYPVAWWAGNIGYRRPQLRVTKTIKTGGASSVSLAAAISRSIGDDFGRLEPGDSGADSGLPTVQIAVSRQFSISGNSSSVGISGHFGKEELHERLGETVPKFDSWSAGIDFSLPLSSKTRFKGELWSGQDLDDYLGGIGQGINRATGESIESKGGWIAIESKPGPKSFIGLGTSMDDPNDDNLVAGSRSKNSSIWINYLRNVRSYLRTGIEVSHWATDYIELENDSALRVQGTLIYSF